MTNNSKTRLRLNQFTMPLNYKDKDIRPALLKCLDCDEKKLGDFRVVRRSIDARSKNSAPVFVLSIEIEWRSPSLPKHYQRRDIEVIDDHDTSIESPPRCSLSGKKRPVIVGAGPAGLMAALWLAEAGLSPLLIERGGPTTDRIKHVKSFFKKGKLHSESNVLFGEGGAGLFSDGKLTSRSKDRLRGHKFLETLVQCGAPRTLLIDAEPHLGTDVLAQIIPALRQRLQAAGCEVKFNSSLTGLHIENGVLRGVVVGEEVIETDACILATGHSARDVYELLSQSGVTLESKPFAIGVRLELPQQRINLAQWGRWACHPRIGAASFRLTRRPVQGSRDCYSFCMCPGGSVIPCASSRGNLTSNGMSLAAREGNYGNAAFLVPVNPDDFHSLSEDGNTALAGCKFQSDIEQATFIAGGSNYSLPACLLTDFLHGQVSTQLPKELSCPRSKPADFREILPGFVCDTLTSALTPMLHQLKGVRLEEILLYAAETRSSSPVRVIRNEEGQSTAAKGLFPAGEGSGYAGGIVSSAIDGLRAAEGVIRIY